jgi:hypothetical protein
VDSRYATLDELLVETLPGEDYTIEGTGQVVRIRALSRYEAIVGQKLMDRGVEHVDAHMISCALVEPRMTVEQARRWQKATPAGLLEPMTRRIREISGMGGRPDRAAYEEFRGEPGTGVRALPGAEDGPDGGGTAADDGQR